MSINPCDLSLVVPCYRDAPHLRENAETLMKVLRGTRWSWEIIFVNDASPADDREVIRRMIADHPGERLSLIDHSTNTGRGRAVGDGMKAACGRWGGFIDIDLEVPAYYLPAMIHALEDGAEVVCARRVYKLRWLILHRAILSRLYVKLVGILLGTRMPDTEAGYKFFQLDRALPIIERCEDPHWFWDTEVMVRCRLAGLRIAFVPVLFLRRPDKSTTVKLFADSLAYWRRLCWFRPIVRKLRAAGKDG